MAPESLYEQPTADMAQGTSGVQDGEEVEWVSRREYRTQDVQVGGACGVAIENDRGCTLSGNPKLTVLRSTRI